MNKQTVQFPTPSNGDVWSEDDVKEFMEEFNNDWDDPRTDSLTEFLKE